MPVIAFLLVASTHPELHLPGDGCLSKARRETIMSDDRHDKNSDDGPVFSAEQARQGEIILRTRTRRIIFMVGLVGIVILAIVSRLSIA